MGLLSGAQDLASLLSIEGLKSGSGKAGTAPAVAAKPDPNRVPKIVMTAIACLAYFCLGGIVGATGPAVPSLATTFGIRETRMGSAFTCRGSGYLTGSILSSFLEGPLGGKPYLLGFSLLLSGLMIFIAAFQPYFYVFLALILLQGLGLGGVDVTGNALLVEIWGKDVDPWMQLMHAAFGLGAVASPIAVGWAGYSVGFASFGVLGAVPIVMIAMEDAILRLLGHEGGILLAARAASPKKGGKRKEGEGEEEEAGGLKPIPSSVRLLISAFLLVYVGLEVGFGGWISTVLLLEGLTSSEEIAAYAVSYFWGAITVGRVLAVPLAMVLQSRSFLVVQLSLSLLGSVLYLWLGSWTLSLAIGMSIVLGLGLSSIFPLMMTLPGYLSLHLDMHSTSVFLVGSTLGEALLPVTMGLLLEVSTNTFAEFMLVGILIMLAIFAMVLWAAAATTGEQQQQGGEEDGVGRSGGDGDGGKLSAVGGGAAAAARVGMVEEEDDEEQGEESALLTTGTSRRKRRGTTHKEDAKGSGSRRGTGNG